MLYAQRSKITEEYVIMKNEYKDAEVKTLQSSVSDELERLREEILEHFEYLTENQAFKIIEEWFGWYGLYEWFETSIQSHENKKDLEKILSMIKLARI